VLQKRAQAVKPRIPELLVTLQPRERGLQRTTLELTAHHAAGLLPLDEPRILQDAEMLDEARKRHAEWLGKLADRSAAMPELGEHGTPRGISERTEDSI
jgi:hypothetical protein